MVSKDMNNLANASSLLIFNFDSIAEGFKASAIPSWVNTVNTSLSALIITPIVVGLILTKSCKSYLPSINVEDSSDLVK
ncbi:hypothetical protein WICMUC_002399 [Wickerhamomyces mucosus]|uniref:Uncharacterized protein n=1 Tax=Wickerhamomyces mucosus TaxID=1378264 RepID=A0A9P8PQ97_9ASCO|nr:hypothetical protein WICMUC_002399 [Wickerhamomyces mucosus]